MTKINTAYKLRLKRQICNLKKGGTKVNCKKFINSRDIPVSRFTVACHLKQQGMKYKKQEIGYLSHCHGENMLFGDEVVVRKLSMGTKNFSEENWRSCVQKSEIICRPRHQKKGRDCGMGYDSAILSAIV